MSQRTRPDYDLMIKCKRFPGLEIRGCREPRAPLHAPAAPSNICREPENVLFDIQNTFMKLMKMQLGSLEKVLILSPDFISVMITISLQSRYLICREPN